MRPTTALNDDNVLDLNALLHPGIVFEHPRDVVSNPGLSLSEKRAILASWASDASAIASCPSLRAPEGLKAPVKIDEILEALCALDDGPRNPPGGSQSACGRSNVPRPRRTTMQSQTSEEIAEALDRDLARKLQQQVAEWKAMRAPVMTRTPDGIRVERRSRRRPDLNRLSV